MRTGELAVAEGGDVGTRDTLHSGVGADVVSGLVRSVGASEPGGAQDIGNGGNQSTPSGAMIPDPETSRISPSLFIVRIKTFSGSYLV